MNYYVLHVFTADSVLLTTFLQHVVYQNLTYFAESITFKTWQHLLLGPAPSSEKHYLPIFSRLTQHFLSDTPNTSTYNNIVKLTTLL
jgi:hypothetical protein